MLSSSTSMTSVYATMALYLLVLFGIGVWCVRRNKTSVDFLLAGRNLGVVAATMTLVASIFGGMCLNGASQMAFEDGYISIAYAVIDGLFFVLLIFVINKMANFAKYTTITEYLEDRFDSKALRVASSVLSMVSLIGIIGSQVTAVTGVLQVLGIQNHIFAAVLSMIVIIALTAMGGLLAVTITDALQMIIIIIGVTWVFIMALGDFGGFAGISASVSEMSATLPKTYRTIPSMTLMWLSLPFAMYLMIGQDAYQRVFACKDRKTAVKALIASAILTAVISAMPALLGIIGRIGYSDIIGNNTASTFPVVALSTLPKWAAGIVVAAALSAILSTADSLLSAAVSHFVNDIYVPIFAEKSHPSEKKLLWISRVFTVVGGASAILFSLAVPRIIDSATYAYYIYTGGVFCPIIFGLFWKKTTKQGAIAGLIGGSVFTLLSLFKLISIANMPGEMFGGIASAIFLVAVSLMTAKSHMKTF